MRTGTKYAVDLFTPQWPMPGAGEGSEKSSPVQLSLTKGLLAGLLDSLASTQLSQKLKKNPGLSLRQAYDGLDSVKKAQIRQELGPVTLGKIFALSQETQASLQEGNLLGLAKQLQEQGKHQTAQKFLGLMAGQTSSTPLSQGAGQELDILFGKGSLGERFEQVLDRGMDELFSLPLLLGMMAGGLSYRVFRGLSTRALFPDGIHLSRFDIRGRQALASTVGLLGESAVFTHTIRRANALLGHEVHEGPEAWRHEYLGALSLLGSLRLFGFGFGTLSKNLAASGQIGGGMALLIPNLAMYTGIVASQHVNRFLGVPTDIHSGTDWFGALFTLAHFKAAGFLVRGLTPRFMKKWERDLDERVVEARMHKMRPDQFQELINRMAFERAMDEGIPSLLPSFRADPYIRNYSYEVMVPGNQGYAKGGALVFAEALRIEGDIFTELKKNLFRVREVAPGGTFLLVDAQGKKLIVKGSKANLEDDVFQEGDEVIFLPRDNG